MLTENFCIDGRLLKNYSGGGTECLTPISRDLIFAVIFALIGKIVIGNLGFKIYKRRNRILNEGFDIKEIGKVEVKIIKTYE